MDAYEYDPNAMYSADPSAYYYYQQQHQESQSIADDDDDNNELDDVSKKRNVNNVKKHQLVYFSYNTSWVIVREENKKYK